MDIKKQMYHSLSPVQRASGVYLALGRGDEAEAARLIGSAPKGEGQGKPLLALRQVLDIYNHFMALCALRLQTTLGEIAAARAFVDGWKAAGGSSKAIAYVKRRKEADALTTKAAAIRGELEAVQTATREWAGQNGIPEKIFSGPLIIIPLTQDPGTAVDGAMLNMARKLFGEVKLRW